MRQEYDWVDRTIFLMFAYAYITDWELADSERSLIQSKIDYVLNHRTVTCRLDWGRIWVS